jgi:hypothetical protein
VIELCGVGPGDTFVDVGSGMGQVVMQVAATVGCVAVGVEVSPERHSAGLQLLEYVEAVLADRHFRPFAPTPHPEAPDEGAAGSSSSSSSSTSLVAATSEQQQQQQPHPPQPAPLPGCDPATLSRCRLVVGSLEDAGLQGGLKKAGASVLFVNNAEGIFAPAVAGRDLNDAVSRFARTLADGR